MTRSKAMPVLAAVLVCGALAATVAADSVSFKDGTHVNLQAMRSGAASQRASLRVAVLGERDASGLSVVKRLIVDPGLSSYFGYSLRASRTVAGGSFRVEIEKLEPSPGSPLLRLMETLCPSCQELRATASVRYPDPFELGDGEAFILDLLENPTSGEKIVDVIRVSSSRPDDQPPAPPALRMVNCVLKVDGEAVRGSGSVYGDVISFHVQDHGRFFISPSPLEGYAFEPIARLAGRTITFSAAGHTYEWVSKEPVRGAGAEAAGPLWVWHEAGYESPVWLDADHESPIGGNFGFGAGLPQE